MIEHMFSAIDLLFLVFRDLPCVSFVDVYLVLFFYCLCSLTMTSHLSTKRKAFWDMSEKEYEEMEKKRKTTLDVLRQKGNSLIETKLPKTVALRLRKDDKEYDFYVVVMNLDEKRKIQPYSHTLGQTDEDDINTFNPDVIHASVATSLLGALSKIPRNGRDGVRSSSILWLHVLFILFVFHECGFCKDE